MKKKSSLLAVSCFVLALGGCGKQAAEKEAAQGKSKQEQAEAIFLAFNNKDYTSSGTLLASYLNAYPDDDKVPSFKLMLADLQYEQEQYPQAYVGYRDFAERYPAHAQAEYATYKAAHAKFAQANHVNCDATPTEETIRYCKSYLARNDFTQFREQMRNLERTCQQRLIDREFYIANNYINQHKLVSAKNRLDSIKTSFDLAAYNAEDKALFYEAKLAKEEHKSDELAQLVENLHAQHPQSHFTAMADRLDGGWF